MAPKSRLDALVKKLRTAVMRWTQAKERVRKLRLSLRCAKQGRKNLKADVDRAREKLTLEYPEEDVSDVLAGDGSDDSEESSSAATAASSAV